MITGRLIELKGNYYAGLNLKHEDGSRYQKRINLQMRVRNNKRRAEDRLLELRDEYTRLQSVYISSPQMYFSDFIISWLNSKERTLSPTTHKNYCYMIKSNIDPYFRDRLLKNIKAQDISDYYESLVSRGLSMTTVQHHHMILSQIFTKAYTRNLIYENPMKHIQKPKRDQPKINCYSSLEAQKLWNSVAGHKLEIPVKLALFYGLRRSEVLGLQWTDVDFEAKTLLIRHAVVSTIINGKLGICEKEALKSKSSYRTMPISDCMLNLLLCEKKRKGHLDSPYVCTDKDGNLLKPDEITHAFQKLLKEHSLRSIRFHDLRHTCASVLIAKRTPLIEVQQWLGHSTLFTTADLYAHLEFGMKLANAETIDLIFSKQEEK